MKISAALAALILTLVTGAAMASTLAPASPSAPRTFARPGLSASLAGDPMPAARSTDPATGGRAASAGTVAGAGTRPGLADTMPPFLKDNDDVAVQMDEIDRYLASNPPAKLWALHMAPVLASTADGAASTTDEPPYTPEELEAFRAQVDAFTNDVEALIALFPEGQLQDTEARLERMRSLLGTASPEDLAQLKSAFTAYPGYWNTASHMLGVLQGGPGVQGGVESPVVPVLPRVAQTMPDALPTVPTGQKPVLVGCKEFGSDGTCDKCPPQPAGSEATIFALDMAAFATGASCQFIPPSLLAGTTSVPNPVNVICTAIRVALELATESVKLANDLNGECETRMRRSVVLYYLDETVSSRASQQSHDHHNAYELRIAIEHDLLNVLDSRVSLFQMPASQGGYLNATDGLSVRWVVADTIRMQESAGYTGEYIRNAKDEYAAAETLLASGDYKSAYARYRKAYRAAVRVGREP
jgi:hypothetical protein